MYNYKELIIHESARDKFKDLLVKAYSRLKLETP